MNSQHLAYLSYLLVVLSATVVTASAVAPASSRQADEETVTKISAVDLEQELFVDHRGEQVRVPREVWDRESGSGAAIQSTQRPDAALVGVSANKLIVYDGRNRSFTVVDRPSKADLQYVPPKHMKFVDPDRAQVGSELVRGQIVVGTSFGPLAYDLSTGTWAGDTPFTLSLKAPWLFDTDPRPPVGPSRTSYSPTRTAASS